jgi:hypothetical protein
MKNLGLALLALSLLTTPAIAVEYQGRSLDGKKLPAKVYYYATGGVYDAQVRFDKQRATIYFSEGNQVTIQLKQQVITDPQNIQGFGKLGYYPLSRNFSIGLESDNNEQLPESDPMEGFWRISLKENENE